MADDRRSDSPDQASGPNQASGPDQERSDAQAAPQLGTNVDARLGDETRELLIRGEVEEALRRHDGSQRPKPEEDPERTTGDLGGSGGEQEGGAG